MSNHEGSIVLMGSGELTATMVEVHKALLASLGPAPRAVFLDTPAGFQLNCDQISQRAAAYFDTHVGHRLAIASFKDAETISDYEAHQALATLRRADYVLVGPGSPTYTVRQCRAGGIADVLIRHVARGGGLVAASAAALTMGAATLPVYEIYKVGQALHWADGLGILNHFGLNLVPIPHWNNAEGGTHDTRFCYMGEPRFQQLAAALPHEAAVLGLDEHTACIIDLQAQTVTVKGLGRVVLRHNGRERIFGNKDQFDLAVLRNPGADSRARPTATTPAEQTPAPAESPGDNFWQAIRRLEKTFNDALDAQDASKATNALLELDRLVWQAHLDAQSPEFVTQARERLRDLLVLLGNCLKAQPQGVGDNLTPLIESLVSLRRQLRRNKQYTVADAIRNALHQAGIIIEDIPSGARWRRAGSE